MSINNYRTSLMILLSASILMSCADKLEESDSNNGSLSVVASNLKAVQNEYVPASISDDGNNSIGGADDSTSSAISSDPNKDICAGLDFTACQPRLIRAYLMFGRAAVALTSQIVVSVAGNLSQTPNNSSGVIQIPEKNLTVKYNKRSLLDYDFLILSGNIPVGRVSANPKLYNVQFDTEILDQGKPGSRGGKIDIQVKFTDSQHWFSQISVSDLHCNPSKPDDPTAARIAVTRNAGLWSGQSMFYNGIAAQFSTVKSCSQTASDATGLAIYTDFVADHIAAKAALYMMKRTETSTANIQNFGFSGLCSNYPDFCQGLATANSTTVSALSTYLGGMSNPYCVQRGTATVTFNSNCSSLSPSVANQAFQANDKWVSPSVFYQTSVVIPSSL